MNELEDPKSKFELIQGGKGRKDEEGKVESQEKPPTPEEIRADAQLDFFRKGLQYKAPRLLALNEKVFKKHGEADVLNRPILKIRVQLEDLRRGLTPDNAERRKAEMLEMEAEQSELERQRDETWARIKPEIEQLKEENEREATALIRSAITRLDQIVSAHFPAAGSLNISVIFEETRVVLRFPSLQQVMNIPYQDLGLA